MTLLKNFSTRPSQKKKSSVQTLKRRSISDTNHSEHHARTPEQNAALDNNWLKGHTDFESLTLLFRRYR
jgi:hypothetical protein